MGPGRPAKAGEAVAVTQITSIVAQGRRANAFAEDARALR